jgi:hypothetical protein
VSDPPPGPDFLVFHPDGQITFGHRAAGESFSRAIRRGIPSLRSLGTSGTGLIRLWYHDQFTPDLAPNPLADHVIAALGYHHPTGWYGAVAMSMEEDPATREVPPLPRELQDGIIELQRRGAYRH